METNFSQRAEAEVETEVIREVVMDVAYPEDGMKCKLQMLLFPLLLLLLMMR
jgi:hypothetical protein